MTPDDLVPNMTIRYAYRLPDSIKDSPHWNGTDADLEYAVKIPPRGTLMEALQRQCGPFELVVSNIVAVGGRAATAEQVAEWWDRLPFKAQMMIQDEFSSLMCPSEAEKKSHRDSRKRL